MTNTNTVILELDDLDQRAMRNFIQMLASLEMDGEIDLYEWQVDTLKKIANRIGCLL